MRSTFNFFVNKEGRRFVENLDGTIAEVDERGNPVPTSETETGSEAEKLLEDEPSEETIELVIPVAEGDVQESELDK